MGASKRGTELKQTARETNAKPFPHPGDPVIKEIRLVKQGPAFPKPMLGSDPLVVQIICSITFPSTEVKLTRLWFPGSSFLVHGGHIVPVVWDLPGEPELLTNDGVAW